MNDVATYFRSPQVCKLAHVTPRNLDYWIEQGVITPTVVAGGSGRQHRWTARDVRALRVVGELRHLGVDVATLRLVPEVLEHHAGEGWLLVGPGRARLCTIEDLVDALERDEAAWHVVRLSTVLHGLPTDDDAAAA